jgi:hypothetical protein
MVSNGMKISNSLTQGSSRVYLQKFFSNFDIIFLLEHVTKMQQRALKQNTFGRQQASPQKHFKKEEKQQVPQTFLLLFFTSFSNISSLMEPMNNCHLSENIFLQICTLYIAFFSIVLQDAQVLWLQQFFLFLLYCVSSVEYFEDQFNKLLAFQRLIPKGNTTASQSIL